MKRIRIDNMKSLRRFSNYLINQVFNEEYDAGKIKLLNELLKNHKSYIEADELERRITELERIAGGTNE